MIKYIGIDGCRGGWIAVYIENGEVSVRVESAKRKENSKDAKRVCGIYIKTALDKSFSRLRTFFQALRANSPRHLLIHKG